MKTLLIILIAFFSVTLSQAQGTAPESLKQEMKKLGYMTGKWKGEATIRQQDGSVLKISQEEIIQYKLEGTVILIEGIGRNPEVGDAIVFNALAIVSYNPNTKSFAFKSHVLDGNQTDAYFKIIKDYNFEWGFDTPNKAKIKYTIVLNPSAKTWVEKGEYSPDETTWYPFMDMNLIKVSE